MTIQTTTEDGDLFNETLIQSYVGTPRFVARPWLAERVEAALKKDNCRFVLLTAEPSAGKSTFMAQLAHDHPDWPRYFIRRDQRQKLMDGGARGFLEQVGFQLAAKYPEAFRTDNVRISLSLKVGTSGGEITGADIDRLIASPFYGKTVEIRQQVEVSRGRLVGLKVRELVTDPNLISITDLQRMALFAPGRALKDLGHSGLVVVLVDALDELRYPGLGGTVLEWLIQCPELPDNVRIVITSRPDKQWLATLRSAQKSKLIEETIPKSGNQITRDLTEYARKLVAEPVVQEFLESSKRTEEQFVDDAVDKASGNLGYLDALGRAVELVLTNPYPRYRDIALVGLGVAILAAPDPSWGRERLRRILRTALDSEGVTFTFELASILFFEAQRRNLPAPELSEYLDRSLASDDRWGTSMRARSAHAAALFHQGYAAKAFDELQEAATLPSGFAGYASVTLLSLANRCHEFGKPERVVEPIWGRYHDINLLHGAMNLATDVRDHDFRNDRIALVDTYRTSWCIQSVPDIETMRTTLTAISDPDTRLAYIDHVSARWTWPPDNPDWEGLKALLPRTLVNGTALDAVLGRLFGLRLRQLSDDELEEAIRVCTSSLTTGRPWELGRWR